jgi:hypothetical protein
MLKHRIIIIPELVPNELTENQARFSKYNDVMAIACTVMDAVNNLDQHQGTWGKMGRSTKDTHFLSSYEIPSNVLSRVLSKNSQPKKPTLPKLTAFLSVIVSFYVANRP